MNIFALSALINGVGATVFAFIGYRKNPDSFLHKIFGIYNLTVAFWSFSYFFWQISDSYNQAFFWVGTLSLAANFIPILYLHWMISIINLNKKYNKIIASGYIITIILSLFSYSSFYIVELKAVQGFEYWPVGGFLHLFYIIFLYLGFSGYGIYLLFKVLNKSIGLKRNQTKYLIFASFVGLGCGFSNFFLWYGIPIRPYLNFGVVAYISFLTYAMVVHRLMDIKLVLRSSSVYLSSLISLIVPAVLIKMVVNNYFTESRNLVDFVLLIIAIAIFPTLKNYYYKIANKYFFSSLYDDRKVIADLSEKLRSSIEIRKIFRFITEIIVGSMHSASIGFLLLDENSDKFNLVYEEGLEAVEKDNFYNDSRFSSFLTKENKAILADKFVKESYKQCKKVIDRFKNSDLEIIIPLVTKKRIVGIIILGQKESKDVYDKRDLEVLSIIGSQSAIAVENALLYEETRDFNIKLEKEINVATKDLLEANRQLKQLDVAKSEFVAIASHQLRTPLTIIKGYISMILDKSFGAVPVPINESLEKVYESNERLIRLVDDLLNVSRIESGRLVFNYQIIRIEKMTYSIAEELLGPAKRKNIKLKIKAPKEPLPKVRIDIDKIRQVFMNLVDNAIKYSETGEIIISLKKKDKDIEVCIKDNGMGIREEDLPNIFDKFCRGTGTSLIHTEGTGLGLYVAKEMVEAHNGTIWAESNGAGKGSVFYFTLPIYKDKKKKLAKK